MVFYRINHPPTLLLSLLLLTGLKAYPQQLPMHQDFGRVLTFPERVSGNFGELRSNHFHSGIDYKTDEKTGYEICAAADGFVSRVRISATGYGRAVYVTHPASGVVTVYAHLRAFYPLLEDSAIRLQFAKEQFEVEFFPNEGQFPVTKGQLIGYSGNSGSSEGPHLHFETRELESEKPFDPEQVGYTIADTIAPFINTIVLYRPGPEGALFGSDRTMVAISQSIGTTVLTDTIRVDSSFFVGFEGFDRAGQELNPLGIRQWRLNSGEQEFFSCRIEKFSFDETRMINAAIDYTFKADSGKTVILCLNLPGNKLPFYGLQSGVINIDVNETKICTLRVEDRSGNFREVIFPVTRFSAKAIKPAIFSQPGSLVRFGEERSFTGSFYDVKISPNSLYESVTLNVDSLPPFSRHHLSPLLKIDPFNIAIHDPIELSIRPNDTVSVSPGKMAMMQIDRQGREAFVIGRYTDGMIKGKVRSGGIYFIGADTLAPVANGYDWVHDDLTQENALVFGVHDHGTGLRNYRVSIEGRWVCAEYNARRGTLTINPELLDSTPEAFSVKLELEDHRENRSEYRFSVAR